MDYAQLESIYNAFRGLVEKVSDTALSGAITLDNLLGNLPVAYTKVISEKSDEQLIVSSHSIVAGLIFFGLAYPLRKEKNMVIGFGLAGTALTLFGIAYYFAR